MEPAEIPIHSFIVKIWREEPGDPVAWRGHVTHVPSGERVYLTSLNGLNTFIAPYLLEMGISLPAIE
jgi:hypothetical protein